jgi:serine/threonine protein kinase
MTTKVSGTPKFAGMKYRVVNTLGSGAGSTILLISDKTAGGKRYALKVVRKQEPEDEVYVQQALTEFEAAKKLNHPAIAKVFDCRMKKAWFKIKGVELLLEYVDGKTLDEIEAPELNQLVLIFCQVSSALTHMHRRGVFHGDLKPSNIMLTKTGQVKLIDFGTAWVRGQEKNRIQGTPNFIAPEQANEKTVDEKTDIYELIVSSLHIDPSKRPAGIFEMRDQLSAIAKQMGLAEVDLRGADEEL